VKHAISSGAYAVKSTSEQGQGKSE